MTRICSLVSDVKDLKGVTTALTSLEFRSAVRFVMGLRFGELVHDTVPLCHVIARLLLIEPFLSSDSGASSASLHLRLSPSAISLSECERLSCR